MGRAARTYTALAALALAGGGAGLVAISAAPRAGAAALFSAEPLPDGAAIALAQPVDGDSWTLVVLERLQPGSGCWRERARGLVSLDPTAISDDSLCSRMQSSSGYSLRAADQDLPSPWRLRIEPAGNRLELQAFNPSLPNPITIGTAPRVQTGESGTLPAFRLNAGWSIQGRSYRGRRLGHIYVSSSAPLGPGPIQSLPPAAAPGRGDQAVPGQVISLEVVPFRDGASVSAAAP